MIFASAWYAVPASERIAELQEIREAERLAEQDLLIEAQKWEKEPKPCNYKKLTSKK